MDAGTNLFFNGHTLSVLGALMFGAEQRPRKPLRTGRLFGDVLVDGQQFQNLSATYHRFHVLVPGSSTVCQQKSANKYKI